MRRYLWFSLCLTSAAAACSDGALSPKTRIVPAALYSTADAPSCYPVRFHQRATPLAPFVFLSELTGDIEGTEIVTFDPNSLDFHGVTLHNAGTAHWSITRSIVPGLGSFDTEFDNKNFFVDRPGSPASVIENIGTHRATGGVRAANLEYKGAFTASPEPAAEHDFRGVICP